MLATLTLLMSRGLFERPGAGAKRHEGLRTRPLFITMRHGPWVWALSALLGLLAGANVTHVLPPQQDTMGTHHLDHDGGSFGVLLASIAIMPLIAGRIWHRHFPDFFLRPWRAGGRLLPRCVPHIRAGLSYGQEKVLHAMMEFYSFIALVGGLYVVSGTVHIELKGRPTPLLNTALLAAGAILANIVGTTGASVLLIRPLLRVNEGRIRPIHVVMFIFIVSNCGGCILPLATRPFTWGSSRRALPLDGRAPLAGLAGDAGSAARHLFRHRYGSQQARPGGHDARARAVARRRVDQGHARADLPGPDAVGVFVDPALERLVKHHRHPHRRHVSDPGCLVGVRVCARRILRANSFSFFPSRKSRCSLWEFS